MSEISRRDFIKLSTTNSVYFAIGLSFPNISVATANANSLDIPEADILIRFDQNNICTITIPETELGQGIYTGLATLIAEELDIEWQKVKVERATSSLIYGNQTTGGSYSIRKRWRKFREIAAMTRQVFIESAASLWNISATNCYAINGVVRDKSSDRQLEYSALIGQANKQPLPQNLKLKNVDEFKIIGKNIQRIDALQKVTGEAIFGIDVQLADMLIATTVHAPIFGATVRKFNSKKALQVSGVVKVIQLNNFIAVIAENTWSAFQAAKLVEVDWQFKGVISDSDKLKKTMLKALEQPGMAVVESDKIHEVSESLDTVSAMYSVPFQAHATMEPMNCSVHIHDGICEVWAPTQSPTKARKMAQSLYYDISDKIFNKARAFLKAEKVEDVIVHTTFAGGGFGRRLQQDFVSEAVQIAMQISQPVKLIWRREEDMQHDYYRPAAVSRLQSKLDADGYPVTLSHHIVSPSLRESLSAGYLKRRKGIDSTAVEGAVNLAYDIKHHEVSYSSVTSPVPLGYWRSVGASINACHLECFIDELASIKKLDTYLYRKKLLVNSPRLLATLNRVAELSQWKKDPDAFYGIASHSSYGSHVSQIAKLVSVNNTLQIEHIYCVIDCGFVINPDIVKSQLEGAIIFGLSSLKSEITISNGSVNQNNFNDFEILRYNNSPQISCLIIDSDEDPGGVGEPGVPPSIPAVLNAVYAATGSRVRDLPVNSSILNI